MPLKRAAIVIQVGTRCCAICTDYPEQVVESLSCVQDLSTTDLLRLRREIADALAPVLRGTPDVSPPPTTR